MRLPEHAEYESVKAKRMQLEREVISLRESADDASRKADALDAQSVDHDVAGETRDAKKCGDEANAERQRAVNMEAEAKRKERAISIVEVKEVQAARAMQIAVSRHYQDKANDLVMQLARKLKEAAEINTKLLALEREAGKEGGAIDPHLYNGLISDKNEGWSDYGIWVRSVRDSGLKIEAFDL